VTTKLCPKCARRSCSCDTSRRKGSTRRWRKLREQAIAIAPTDDAGNPLCGNWSRPIEDGHIDVDHVTPLNLGGTEDLDNLQVAHRRCNRAWNT
jgi:5-methylcytosine-specific restriction endonuclease McrA